MPSKYFLFVCLYFLDYAGLELTMKNTMVFNSDYLALPPKACATPSVNKGISHTGFKFLLLLQLPLLHIVPPHATPTSCKQLCSENPGFRGT